jgi:hypothetical protein
MYDMVTLLRSGVAATLTGGSSIRSDGSVQRPSRCHGSTCVTHFSPDSRSNRNRFFGLGRTSASHGPLMMVTPARFERATFPLGGGRSIQLSYGAIGIVTGYRVQLNGPSG